jgi:peptide/nickel transport system permease protein/oligopeptide transport system permease protein
VTVPPGELAIEEIAARPVGDVEGRSLWRSGWIRLRRDRPAMASGVFLIVLALVAIFAPVIVALLGHPPNAPHYDLLNRNTGVPRGRFGGMSWHYLLGVEPLNGRDIFSRTVYGARVSLLVALLATATAAVIGTVLGMLAGYLGGLCDLVIARLMDLLLAIPSVLFAIAIVAVIPNSAFGLSGSDLRIGVLVVVIGIFGWPYIGRIVRGQVLSLREKEFIEASRALGAGTSTIMFRELLPNVAVPVLVYSTLLIPTNILNEAALSYLGVGVRPPTASWGDSLATASHGFFSIEPIFMLAPGLSIFLTVLAFHLLGDGLRDAFDPRGGR